MSNKDPLASLLNYVGTVKPYHTKVYEVILDYVYAESVKTAVTEKYQISVLMSTPDANAWFYTPGIGWDTAPFNMDENQPLVDFDGRGARNWGRWDYPQTSSGTSPSRVIARVVETLAFELNFLPKEAINTFVDMHSIGWDIPEWDSGGFDSAPYDPRMIIEQQDDDSDPVGATITETISFQVT